MKKRKIRYRRWTVVVCVASVMILPQISSGFSAKHSNLTLTAIEDPNLSSELQTLNGYVRDLVSYDKECAQLNKQAELHLADITPLERKSDDLKRRLSDVQNALRAVVSKLKATGKWNDLDTAVLAKMTDAKVRDLGAGDSFKSILEEMASQLTSHANEIGSPNITILRRKLVGQTFEPRFDEVSPRSIRIVRASFSPPPFRLSNRTQCRLAWLNYGLGGAFGNETRTTNGMNDIDCYCNRHPDSCDFLPPTTN